MLKNLVGEHQHDVFCFLLFVFLFCGLERNLDGTHKVRMLSYMCVETVVRFYERTFNEQSLQPMNCHFSNFCNNMQCDKPYLYKIMSYLLVWNRTYVLPDFVPGLNTGVN